MARKAATKPSKVLRTGLKRIEITHAINGGKVRQWGDTIRLKNGKKGLVVCAEGAIFNTRQDPQTQVEEKAARYLQQAICDVAIDDADIRRRGAVKYISAENFARSLEDGLIAIPTWHDHILTEDEMKHCFKLAIQRAEMDEAEAQLEKKGLLG